MYFQIHFQNLLRIFSIVVIFPSHQMAFQILLAVNLLMIMDTFLERMDTVRPKKAMYFGDVSLITSSNVGLEPKRSMMNQSITAEYIIMILQMQMYLTFSEIQWGLSCIFSKIRAKFEIHKPFLLLLTAVLVQKICGKTSKCRCILHLVKYSRIFPVFF